MNDGPAPRPRRRGARRPATPAAVVGWVALAGMLALARLGETLDSAGGDVTHPPVVVTGDWQHAPVPVVATAPQPPQPPPLPTPARPLAPPAPRALPRPFAALRMAAGPLIMPRLGLPRVLSPSFPALRSLLTRARPGQPVHVTISAYCLRGLTRRGTSVRPGIVAADPRVFPLARHIELYAAGRYLGRFRVEDTGSAIRGTRIDIWTPDCADAIRFGMRAGVAELVAVGD